jgi:hypothetical protein
MKKIQMIKNNLIGLLLFLLFLSFNSKINKKIQLKLQNTEETKYQKEMLLMNGCIHFYDEQNYKGNVVLELCDWKGTTVPKLSTESNNSLIKKIKSIKLSKKTELYLNYEIEKIPQNKLTISENVANVAELIGSESLITILEVINKDFK